MINLLHLLYAFVAVSGAGISGLVGFSGKIQKAAAGFRNEGRVCRLHKPILRVNYQPRRAENSGERIVST